MLDIPFEVAPKFELQELYPEGLPAKEVPGFLARLKCDAYYGRKIPADPSELIITADTVVILGDEVIGKPANEQTAIDMLLHLSGKTHTVVTGVAIRTADRAASFSVESKVKFGVITPEEARYYVEKYRPLDKAGSYGIQEWIGAVAVESIEGSFYNVMGLPVHQLYRHLLKF